MPVSLNSQLGSEQHLYTELLKNTMSSLRVSMPGIIQSFDPTTVTCVVQPALKGSEIDNKDNLVSLNLPLLVDVPVVFPRGGGVTLTFPVSVGDECLVIFADRCIDFWWQSGGVQESVDLRQHDLSDAFALVGPQSQAQKISNISTSAAQLRTDDGGALIELDPSSHAVSVKTSGNLIAQASGSVAITSPTITFTGDVTINGGVTVTNDVTAGGKSLQNHVHSGVQTGGGTTGEPV